MIIIYILTALVLLLIAFGFGEKSKRKECEQLRISLCDAYGEIQDKDLRIKRIKKSWYDLARERTELKESVVLLRKANSEIADEHYNLGLAEGDAIVYKRAWQEVSDQLIKESVVIKNKNIVEKVSLPHQLVDVKC